MEPADKYLADTRNLTTELSALEDPKARFNPIISERHFALRHMDAYREVEVFLYSKRVLHHDENSAQS